MRGVEELCGLVQQRKWEMELQGQDEGSSLQIFESLQQRVESLNCLGFVSGLQQVRGTVVKVQ